MNERRRLGTPFFNCSVYLPDGGAASSALQRRERTRRPARVPRLLQQAATPGRPPRALRPAPSQPAQQQRPRQRGGQQAGQVGWPGPPAVPRALRGPVAVVAEAALQGGPAGAAAARLVAEGLVGAGFNDAVCKERHTRHGGSGMAGQRGLQSSLLRWGAKGGAERCPSTLRCRCQ